LCQRYSVNGDRKRKKNGTFERGQSRLAGRAFPIADTTTSRRQKSREFGNHQPTVVNVTIADADTERDEYASVLADECLARRMGIFSKVLGPTGSFLSKTTRTSGWIRNMILWNFQIHWRKDQPFLSCVITPGGLYLSGEEGNRDPTAPGRDAANPQRQNSMPRLPGPAC